MIDDQSTPPNELIDNGQTLENYKWGQTLKEVEITIILEDGVKSKQVKVEFKPTTISVKVKGVTIIEGILSGSIVKDECIWTMQDRELTINIPKRQHIWWPSVVQGESEIDIRLCIPEEEKFEDLDSGTQNTIQKMMLEQKLRSDTGVSISEAKNAAGLENLHLQQKALKSFQAQHPEVDLNNAKISF